MAEGASSYPFMCLLLLLTVCTSGEYTCEQEELKIEEKQNFHYSHRLLLHNLQLKATQHDTLTTLPTTPVTVSPETIPTPTIVTVPATNPEATPVAPVTVPSANPVNSPVPVTNPVTTPSTVPGAQPATSPVTTYPPPSTGVPATTPVTNPVSPPATPVTNPVSPPATTGAPAAVPGQSWCVAKSGVLESSLQAALDYACGIGGADCSGIQQGSSCYNPISLQNHASFAFNSYYQKNPSPTSCDFGGTAMITNTNPSSGTCIYPSSSSSPATATTPTTPATTTPTTPATTTPTTPATTMTPTMPTTITPTPTTSSSSGAIVPVSASPTVFNTSNPASGSTTVVGDNPPSVNSSTSLATTLQPFTGCIILVISVVTRRLILDK
ncbi:PLASMODESMATA CALLOSE-BINDING PROTEIN 4 isoform X2 [Rhododendron vialii]|uniref:PLASMODESMATA CALLOSE-BINDING PROTEIN 4 isoform X2 n=1 Tax=Rhododendron vialii TaxID=182163 RepID=UPI00265F4957|nr:PLASMODESMATA CALLOSE-BINDING PROTEIN 4 isoform X2 [Rhododendron vialii]